MATLGLLLLTAPALLPTTPAATIPVPAGPEPVDGPAEAAVDAVGDEGAARLTGGLPLRFEENLGQVHPDVAFLARASGYTLFLAPTEVVFALPSTPEDPVAPVVRMTFVEANPSPALAGRGELPGKSNYFLGNDPTRWVTDVPHYSRVIYEDAWPGVDVVFYGAPGGGIEFDFVVAPGHDPAVVALEVQGADPQMAEDGALRLTRSGADLLHLPPPRTYQMAGAAALDVPSSFRIDRGVVRFVVDDHDATVPLVIDPVVLSYATYLGGSDTDEQAIVAVDDDGFAYVMGETRSPNFPTEGAYQATQPGSLDLFITKLAPAGDEVIYSTYLGGSGTDQIGGIAVDTVGSAYMTGATLSDNFPLKNAYDNDRQGGFRDVFVTKLNAAGNGLAYSTYLGAGGTDFGNAITVDSTGAAYVAGIGDSGFPTTAGAFQTGHAGNRDAFLTKFTPSGTSLAFSTLLGGSAVDSALAVAADAAGDVYLAGRTESSNFPMQAPYDAFKSGTSDAFVTKLDATGASLEYSTYLGGSGLDRVLGLAIDSSGSAHVVGDATATFPVLNAIQPTSGGGTDAFLTKFNPAGNTLAYSTYLGGASTDTAYEVVVMSDGSTYVAGSTASTNFPTQDPVQAANAGGSDAFAAVLNAAGSAFTYSTYVGGSGEDAARGLGVDGDGNAFIAGDTGSTDFPVQNAYQATYQGGFRDAFAARIGTPVTPRPRNVDLSAGPGVGEISIDWDPPPNAGTLGLTEYRLYRGASPTPLAFLASTDDQTTVYLDSGLGNGATRYYAVTAVGSAGESYLTASQGATTFALPTAPLGLLATAGPGATDVSLSWQVPAEDGGAPLVAYRLYRGAQTGGETFWQEVPAATLSVVDPSVVPGTQRTYYATATNLVGEGPASNEFGGTPPTGADPPPLPSPRSGTASVWTGTKSYTFGGTASGGGFLDEIVEYDPVTNTVSVLETPLPTARCCLAAAWTGTDAYLFGGQDASGSLQQVLQFNPTTGTLTDLGDLLPTGRCCLAASYAGGFVWLFGGQDASGNALGSVLRFDPATNSLLDLGDLMPTDRCCMAASSDGTDIFLFGGRCCTTASGSDSQEILKFSPATTSFTSLGNLLPTGRCCMAAAWSGTQFYLFGGRSGETELAEVLAFDPVSNQVASLGDVLPTQRCCVSAVWTGTGALVFGGEESDGEPTDEIFRFTPGAPQATSATAGPASGEITVGWSAPLSGAPTGYRVYRGTASAPLVPIAVVPAGTLSYTDAGLGLAATRFYRVSAVGSAAEGPQGNQASATTFDVPSAPQNLDAPLVDPDLGSVHLSWDPPASDGGTPVTNYRIYRMTLLEPETVVATIGSATTYADTSCQVGDVCYYRVSALNLAGEGAKSERTNEVVGTALPV